MNEQQPKYFTDKRAACVCDECGSYADNSMMVKHYATCTFAEASEITRLLSLVEGQAQTIKDLAKALYDINHMIVGRALVTEPTESIKAISFYALRKLDASTPPSKDGQG